MKKFILILVVGNIFSYQFKWDSLPNVTYINNSISGDSDSARKKVEKILDSSLSKNFDKNKPIAVEEDDATGILKISGTENGKQVKILANITKSQVNKIADQSVVTDMDAFISRVAKSDITASKPITVEKTNNTIKVSGLDIDKGSVKFEYDEDDNQEEADNQADTSFSGEE